MSTNYNRIAGQSLERLAALSDGIFAVAMTLLVLDLHVPVIGPLQGEQALWVSGALQKEQALWDALVSFRRACSPNLFFEELSGGKIDVRTCVLTVNRKWPINRGRAKLFGLL
jgi:hypothetical protein